MIVDINLLPDAYRRARKHERWFHWGTTAGFALLAVELMTALFLYIHTGDRRELLASTRESRHLLQAIKQETAAKRVQANVVQTNVVLATELRATHRWSRLLAALTNATPEDVTLRTVSTDPARWTLVGPRVVAAKKPPETGKAAARGKEELGVAPCIKGLVIRGYAASHQGLSDLMTTLHKSDLFGGIDLQEMKRDQLGDREALAFELRGRW